MTEENKGIIYAMSAYIIWGAFPLYWKLLEHVDSIEILINRIIWSFVFTTLFILLIKQRKKLIEDIKSLWKNKKLFLALLSASLVITCNWYLYIWAVTHDHVVDASLGYYINPLITVVFGMIFFKEKLSKAQICAVAVAFIGVMVLTISYGQIPWVALLIAISFATYSALKKKITLDATRGLAIETLFIFPIALGFYIYLWSSSEPVLFSVNITTDILLILGGIITAVPLVLFSKGAQRIPQYLIGFFQYFTPTVALITGVVLYNEPFTTTDFISFTFIWAAVIIFATSTITEIRKRHAAKKEAVNV
ncbi:EamA family transporter RarD [Ureibacillus manganicus]|uniref:Transporter n=1 Tax=Ureibacillus manganicus DSM 26584 TaxID=1384049 RepID=A0A0A3HZD4_9BACL|nr:EamA family transporter RarD [Ureibacillus manganicus]KGR77769.1 transporter [Ureibacillus manganicus DSM 26584]